MEIVVKKSALFNLLKNALNEDGQARSDMFLEPKNMEDFGEDDSPIEAQPQMALQLSEEQPPVGDPEFVPGSIRELELASMVIMKEVPINQVEFVYRFLHKLLDMALDREEEEQGQGTSNIVTESREFYMKKAADRVRQGEDAADIAQDMIDLYDEFEGMDSFELGQQIEDMTYSSMGFDMSDASDDAPPPEPETTLPSKTIRRPRRMIARDGKATEELKPASVVEPTSTFEESDVDDLEKIDITSMTEEEAVKATAEQIIQGLGMLAIAIQPLETQAVAIDKTDSLSPDQKAAALNKIPHRRLGIDNYKTLFMFNYDSPSRRHADMFGDPVKFKSEMVNQIKVAMEHGPSFLTPPVTEYEEFEYEEDDTLPDVTDSSSVAEDLPYDARKYYSTASDKNQFLNGFNAGADHAAAEDGTTPDLSSAHPDYVAGYEFGYEDISGEKLSINEAIRTVRSKYETAASAGRKAAYKEKLASFKAFNMNIMALQKKLGTSLDETIEKIADEVVKIMQEKITNLDYNPDKNAKRNEIFNTNFAATTVYATGTAAGPGGSKRESAKPYQGNTSATFHRRVKEEQRADIISDFLDRLTSKYLTKGDMSLITGEDADKGKTVPMYKISTGRKDPDNPKRNEKYGYSPEEFRQAAESFANDRIDAALEDQAKVARGEVLVPEDEEAKPVLSDEETPKALTDEEIAEKLSNTKDFQTLAPFFGFSGAPGMRQWFLKFAKRFFEMGIISSKTGDRSLLKFHTEMVEAVLETLSEKLPDLMTLIVDEDDGTGSHKEMMSVLQRITPQVEEAYQSFLDVGDLSDVSVPGRSKDGSQISMPFLDTLGGQLARTINGMFFKKVLTRLDKEWTDYVADELQSNKQLQDYIVSNISKAAKIDAKAAKSLAEYFIGKKNAPIIVVDKAKNKKVFKSELEGNPTKGVKNLLKFGIDASAYEIIRREAYDYFEDMLMTDFAKIYTEGDAFEGQYREIIVKNYDKLKKNDKEFRKVVLQGLDDIITGSAQRMAFANLSDYEVQK